MCWNTIFNFKMSMCTTIPISWSRWYHESIRGPRTLDQILKHSITKTKTKSMRLVQTESRAYKVATIDDPNFDLFNFKRQITIMEKWNSSFDGFTFNKSCHLDQCFNTTLYKMSVYIMFNHYMRHVYQTVWPALHCLMIQVQHES